MESDDVEEARREPTGSEAGGAKVEAMAPSLSTWVDDVIPLGLPEAEAAVMADSSISSSSC